MLSSGFAEDETVIDVHDDFGGGLGKIHERYKWWREAPVIRTSRKSKCMLTFQRTKPCQFTKSHHLQRVIVTIDQLLLLQTHPPRAIMFLESLMTFVGQFAHGDTPSRAVEWDRVTWNSWEGDNSMRMC